MGVGRRLVMFKPIFCNLPRGIPVVFAGPSPPVRAEEVDRTLQRQDSGLESALLYAKAWSKYTKELLAWVEKRLSMGELGHRWRGKYKSIFLHVGRQQLSSTYHTEIQTTAVTCLCHGPCTLVLNLSVCSHARVSL